MAKKKKYKVGIIGCGKILARHIEAIEENKKHFELAAVCDIDEKAMKKAEKETGAPGFKDYKKMLKDMKGKMNFVSITAPNSLHYEMAMAALEAGYDVLIEKPIDFKNRRIHEIGVRAEELGREAYAVLQVRYNPTIAMIRDALEKGLIGKVRSANFIQRWQRPYSYFGDWRGDRAIGGGTLYECGIHYIDILYTLFGIPTVHSTSTFSTKHKHVDIEDTIYSIVEYKANIPGSIEVTISSEPHNLECSLAIQGSKGFIKIGGTALNEVETALFENKSDEKKFKAIEKKYGKGLIPNSYGTHVGSCPNHPTLYAEIAAGRGIDVREATHSIEFIQNIYAADEVEY